MTTTILPKKRIDVIDALRGFALLGLLLVHCIEHFDALPYGGEPGPLAAWLNTAARDVVQFLFLGKAYAIFSLLFGLSFFIQMQNQVDRGLDFRWRFVWRLVLLFVIGYLNGLFYSGEILVVYALFGFFLIPLWKVPARGLGWICVFFIFQIPSLIYFIYLFYDPEAAATSPVFRTLTGTGYRDMAQVLSNGSFGDIMSFNGWKGQELKWLYYLRTLNATRILGLFTLGMLIGRLGIHRNEELMVRWAKRALGWGVLLFAVFFCLGKLRGGFGLEGKELNYMFNMLSRGYTNLGVMLMEIALFVLAYFRLDARAALSRIAPVGRMSLTSYLMQSLLGMLVFYGVGLGLAPRCGFGLSLLIGIGWFVCQVWFGRWWLSRYSYGPVEWVWRSATWIKRVPFKR